MLQDPEEYLSWAFTNKAATANVSPILSLALEQLLTELEDFLKILDQENLSSTAVVKKSGLAELLRLYTRSSSKCGPGAFPPPHHGNQCLDFSHPRLTLSFLELQWTRTGCALCLASSTQEIRPCYAVCQEFVAFIAEQ